MIIFETIDKLLSIIFRKVLFYMRKLNHAASPILFFSKLKPNMIEAFTYECITFFLECQELNIQFFYS